MMRRRGTVGVGVGECGRDALLLYLLGGFVGHICAGFGGFGAWRSWSLFGDVVGRWVGSGRGGGLWRGSIRYEMEGEG